MENIRIKIAVDSDDLVKTETILKESRDATKKFEKSLNDVSKAGEKGFKDVKNSAEGAKKPFLDLKGVLDNFAASVGLGFNTDQVTRFGTAVAGTSVAVNGTAAAFRILRIAIAATGIGLLIAAVVSLIAYFKRTDEGATKLDGIMRAMGNTITVLAGYAIKFGEAVFNAFSNPLDALKKLGEFIVQNIVNRFTSVITLAAAVKQAFQGDFTGAMKTTVDAMAQFSLGVTNITDKLTDLGKEINAAAVAGYDLAFMWDALEDRERAFQKTNAETERDVTKLLIAAKNRTLSEQERIDLLNKASSIEQKNFNEALAIAQERLRLVKLEEDFNKSNGDNQDKRNQAVIDAEVAVIKLQQESFNLREKIAVRLDALYNQEFEDYKKYNEKILKVDAEFQKRTNEQFEQYLKDFQDKADYNNEFAVKSFVKRMDDEIKALATANEEKQKLEDDHNKQVEEGRSAVQQASVSAISDIVNNIASIQNNADDARLNRLNFQKEQELKVAGDNAEAREKIEKTYAAKEALIKRKQAERDKRLALFNAIVNLATGVTKALSSSPPPFNLILAGITAAAGAFQIAAIQSQQIPAFAKGTKNAPGGLALVGEEGPEIVEIPRGAKVNTAFETKMMLPKLKKGVIESASQQKGANIDYNKLARALAVEIGTRFESLPINSFSMDERGFTRSVIKNGNRINYYDKKYSGQ